MPGRSPVTARSGPQDSRLTGILQDWAAEPPRPEVEPALCPGCGGPAERSVQDLPAAGLRQTTWRCRADGPRCRPTVNQEPIAVAPVGPVIGGWQVRLCVDCGAEYKPAAGNQKRCPECRDKPAATAPAAGTETPEERRGRLGREAAVRSLATEAPRTCACGAQFQPTSAIQKRCAECQKAKRPAPSQACYTCGADFVPNRCTQIRCTTCANLKPGERLAIQQARKGPNAGPAVTLRTCACGAEFQAVTSRHQRCKDCAQARVTRACPDCGKDFRPNRGQRLRCSACRTDRNKAARQSPITPAIYPEITALPEPAAPVVTPPEPDITADNCARITPELPTRTCPDCSQEFEANPGQQRCLPCNRKRQEVLNAERREADKAFWAARRPPVEPRRCVCGVEFAPRNLQAVYCPDCSEKQTRQKAGTPEHRAERKRRQDEAIARVRAGLPPVDPPQEQPEEVSPVPIPRDPDEPTLEALTGQAPAEEAPPLCECGCGKPVQRSQRVWDKGAWTKYATPECRKRVAGRARDRRAAAPAPQSSPPPVPVDPEPQTWTVYEPVEAPPSLAHLHFTAALGHIAHLSRPQREALMLAANALEVA